MNLKRLWYGANYELIINCKECGGRMTYSGYVSSRWDDYCLIQCVKCKRCLICEKEQDRGAPKLHTHGYKFEVISEEDDGTTITKKVKA